ncbi:phosphoethanolamine--lipid A transferase [Marinobacter sediminum]|uniref:phosphoethanolamine transferase n=1 Tax=Marinobacter sediminum TaxID=256323 RepID=UPI0020309124|nr:phosphoethanolamine--lipid A transferase [Marinobacter sediminum]MCM0613752.1 phosphoethanolamine--lipid A transferase [Marinobacter sediminum]
MALSYKRAFHAQAVAHGGTARFQRPEIKPYWMVLISAVALTAFYNFPFYSAIEQYVGFEQPMLMGKLVLLLLLVNHLLISLFSVRFVLKPVLVFLFFSAALSGYFMNAYGVLIDKHMLQNVLETDVNEARGLLSTGLLVHVVLFFVVPVVLLNLIRVKWPVGFKKITHWLAPVAINVVLILVLALTSYEEMASTFRNHRDIKDLVVPVNSVAAMVSLANKAAAAQFPQEYQQVGLDATVSLPVADRSKPNLVVFVLGETARADHFGLNGYERDTTPELSQLARTSGGNLINFPRVSSCGTATALSVPCMFSWLGRPDYDEAVAKNSDNFLDVMTRAGIVSTWLDNNSGCKGMCDRIPTIRPEDTELCQGEYCDDLVLLKGAHEQLDAADNKDHFMVLHQLGSHGPEYFKRSKPDQKRFLPECESNELQTCDQETIINAYDDSILVTDQLLAETVRMLKSMQSDYNTALVYVSDHGESLGEGGIYLHGIPYMLAPEAQTHVPMVMWLSDGFRIDNRIDAECLKQVASQLLSHDNLFSSMLGLMNVESEAVKPSLNIFESCRTH